jgi:AraC-like DNA-binding protein
MELHHRRDAARRQVRNLHASLIPAGPFGAEDIARFLGLNLRTMNRRLAAEDTCFARLRDEARFSMARQLLLGTNIAAHKISEQLGHANASAFTLAYSRWSGSSPERRRAMAQRRNGRK